MIKTFEIKKKYLSYSSNYGPINKSTIYFYVIAYFYFKNSVMINLGKQIKALAAVLKGWIIANITIGVPTLLNQSLVKSSYLFSNISHSEESSYKHSGGLK